MFINKDNHFSYFTLYCSITLFNTLSALYTEEGREQWPAKESLAGVAEKIAGVRSPATVREEGRRCWSSVTREVHRRSGKRKCKVAMPLMTYIPPGMLDLRMIFMVFYGACCIGVDG
jgi:hypothetical protein